MDMNCCCFAQIQSGNVVMIENLGKFESVGSPGLNVFAYPFSSAKGVLSLRIQQLDVSIETKTLDNVVLVMKVAIQYQVKKGSEKDAYYSLTDARAQITSYVEDSVRAAIPALSLDDAFANKDSIALKVKEHLDDAMGGFGFQILQSLIVDIQPNAKVVYAMNEINSAKRLKDAAMDRAEAEKIIKVKKAEAEAESKYLSGVGIARQRHAIVDGMKESVKTFNSGPSTMNNKEIINMMMTVQYLDLLTTIGHTNTPSSLFIGHQPAGVSDVQAQLARGMASTF